MTCPVCKQEIARHEDGTFVLHGMKDGSLCEGTNGRPMGGMQVTFGGMTLPAHDVMFHEDEKIWVTMEKLR